jgi:hypothetical protein
VERDRHHALVKLRQAQDVRLAALGAPRFEPLAAEFRARAAIEARDSPLEATFDVCERGELVLHSGPEVVWVRGQRGENTGSFGDG